MKEQLESAKRLVEYGFHVFPVVEMSKLPAIKDYPNKATRDHAQLEKWFGNGHHYNIGISTTHFGDNESLFVIDVDNKKGKKGGEELIKLELEGYDIPRTFEQTTPTGGRHIIYRTPHLLKQGVDVLAPGIDIRAKGGYIVGAGSTLENGIYEAIPHEVVPLPDWIEKRAVAADVKEHTPPIQNINPEVAKSRAIDYLANHAPISIEFQGGDHTAFKVAARVKDFGVDKITALELLALWNDKCQPPWSDEELSKFVENAYHYGNQVPGSASPQADFKPVAEPKIEVNGKFYLDEINAQYAIVYLEGSHFIVHETVEESGAPKRVFMTEQTFKRKFSPKTVQQGEGRPRTQADIWLNWPKRKEFSGVCFAPERTARNNYLNLWRGFAVTPLPPEQANERQKKGVQMFLDHAKENVCNGNDTLFNWLIGYFAHLVQRPYERPLTTLVFKGSKGTGKNALIDRVGNLLGCSHYLVAHDGRYLTSNFNGHFDSCLMLVLDEAFWSGDKAAEGKLKGMTTSEKIIIERKGKEPYMIDNLVRMVVIGNEDWLVPASADERRYAVFELGEGRKQDNHFFQEMKVIIDREGGNRLLLHHLQSFDLSTVDVNVAPVTSALLDQKTHSLDMFGQWWVKCLQDGHIICADFSEDWPAKMSKADFRRAYERYAKDRNVKGWTLSDAVIGKKLKVFLPSVDPSKQSRIPGTEKRIKEYHFPLLDQARKEWEKHFGHEVKWDE